MRTYKQNIIELNNADRTELRFTTTGYDPDAQEDIEQECSVYVNPDDGEVVITFGKVEVYVNAIPASNTKGLISWLEGSVLEVDRTEAPNGEFNRCFHIVN